MEPALERAQLGTGEHQTAADTSAREGRRIRAVDEERVTQEAVTARACTVLSDRCVMRPALVALPHRATTMEHAPPAGLANASPIRSTVTGPMPHVAHVLPHSVAQTARYHAIRGRGLLLAMFAYAPPATLAHSAIWHARPARLRPYLVPDTERASPCSPPWTSQRHVAFVRRRIMGVLVTLFVQCSVAGLSNS